jgi:hypothetical protein
MTYKHLTTRELTLIADFWYQGTKLIGLLNYFSVVKKPSIVFIVSSTTVKPSTNIFRLISDISVVVVGSRPNCQLSKLTISMRKSRQVGLLILLLVVMNTQLAAVCAPFIACLPAISMASPLNSYR